MDVSSIALRAACISDPPLLPNGPGDQLPPGHSGLHECTRGTPDTSSRMPGRSPGDMRRLRPRPMGVSCIALLGSKPGGALDARTAADRAPCSSTAPQALRLSAGLPLVRTGDPSGNLEVGADSGAASERSSVAEQPSTDSAREAHTASSKGSGWSDTGTATEVGDGQPAQPRPPRTK